jgi:hypothetical protein
VWWRTRNPRKRYNEGPVADVLCLVLFLVFLGGLWCGCVLGIPRKRYNQGPVADVLCLVLFLVFLGGWGVVAYLGFQGGDIIRVLYPTDSQVRS